MKKKSKSKISVDRLLFNAFLGIILLSIVWIIDGFYPIQEEIKKTAIVRENVEQVALYSNQINDDLQSLIVSAIDKAEKSVVLIIYSLNDEAVIKSLKRKSEQGIAVKVVCDAKASPHISKKIGSKVELVRRIAPGLMHQKILAIDGRKVLLGSANMTGESLKLHGNLVSVLDSSELAALVHSKANGMGEYDPAVAFPKFDFIMKDQKVELWFLPDNVNAAKQIVQLIRSAEKTIRVAMFTWTRFDFAKAIIDAKQRGVDVQVVIDHNSGKGVSAKVFEMLKKNNVWAKLSEGEGLLHHKFLYIDGKTLVHGSANWTKAAFTKNDDCFMIVHDLNREQQQQLELLWNKIAGAKE